MEIGKKIGLFLLGLLKGKGVAGQSSLKRANVKCRQIEEKNSLRKFCLRPTSNHLAIAFF